MLADGPGKGLGAGEETLLEVGEDDQGAVSDVLFLILDPFTEEKL